MIASILALVLIPIGVFLALVVAPVEAFQGEPYRILYIHVPSVVASYAAFTVTFMGSMLYLWKRNRRFDHLAYASAEIGQLFLTMVLVTGPIWGKPVWGTWWTWDARLTTALILWFIFAGYLMVRAWSGAQAARVAAVIAIIGFLDIPLIHWSARLLRTLHPRPTVFRPEGPDLPVSMLAILLVNVAAFLIAYWALLRIRVNQERLRERILEEGVA
jgi:heme exporter protein C